MSTGEVELQDLSREYSGVVAVDAINLKIEGGEFFSLLGPSGCGKTTTLRMIAGLENASSGRILLDGIDVAPIPAYKRNVHTVFQNYALFPHLNVFENIAFGLRRRHLPKSDILSRVAEVMKLVHLSGFEQRRPQQLSGGQQQRVALARSLVLRPAVLLLDEPLGALDAKIRKTLRVELQTLQRQVGITFVFVTHDQEEALTMSDRMAVMNGGRIEQVGAPRDVYEYPETEFVADFLGVSNRMEVEVCDVQDRTCVLRIGNERVVAAFDPSFDTPNGRVQIVVRPEQVKVTSNPNRSDAPLGAVSGRVERVTYAGSVLQVSIRIATGSLIEAAIPNTGDAEQLEQGTLVIVHLPSNAVRVLCAAPSDLA